MAKVVNITEKLEFDTDPTLVIGNLKVRVRADANGCTQQGRKSEYDQGGSGTSSQ